MSKDNENYMVRPFNDEEFSTNFEFKNHEELENALQELGSNKFNFDDCEEEDEIYDEKPDQKEKGIVRSPTTIKRAEFMAATSHMKALELAAKIRSNHPDLDLDEKALPKFSKKKNPHKEKEPSQKNDRPSNSIVGELCSSISRLFKPNPNKSRVAINNR